jgi:hypothetical protein
VRESLRFFALGWLAALVGACATLPDRTSLGGLLGEPTPSPVSQESIAAGLRETLELGTRRAVGRTARNGGFRDHSRIRLRLPRELEPMASGLGEVGLGGQMNVLELAMNRAAEHAAAEGLEVFGDAIAGLAFPDASAVLNGPEDAATHALRRRAGAQVRDRFTPVVDDAMRQVGLTQAYEQLRTRYDALPGAEPPELDLLDYTTGRTVDGLFTILAEEERRIRSDPAARNSERLRELFGRAESGADRADPTGASQP